MYYLTLGRPTSYYVLAAGAAGSRREPPGAAGRSRREPPGRAAGCTERDDEKTPEGCQPCECADESAETCSE